MNLLHRAILISTALALASTPVCLAVEAAQPAEKAWSLDLWPVLGGVMVLVLLAVMLYLRASMRHSTSSIGESSSRGRKKSGSAKQASPWVEAGRRMKSPPTDSVTPREPGSDDDENDNDFTGDSGGTDRGGGDDDQGGGGPRSSGGGGAYG